MAKLNLARITPPRRADGAADIDADAVGGDRILQVLPRNKLRHDRLPGGGLHRADDPVEKRKQQQVSWRGNVQRDDERERGGNQRDRELRAGQKLSQVDEIRHRAGRNRKKKHRQCSRHLHQRHNERIRVEAGHQPARRGAVHPSADVRHDRGDPQRGEAAVPEGAQAGKDWWCGSRRRAHIAAHAHII
jgi:hypothetical protein